ncbi:MAG: mannose-1-phosphate guanylyltransferase [Cyclobacteriaceae bacterium]|nr:mannose-1-phosphate guanylyltransferase [Cyclobacteriaceae bacterium]MCB0498969.1 mannose-1-phosphate guanylyltransferase [Cyclobacteriaceae bacterium]MCB9238245.1 mannose-1-phosphate guanylyltransferase [Flammeovirgaceae bacterium]MCO5272170.1 mannose-1-phosphate guanylyltransferase [Cyclobacteriaceae bacterium]MCW5902715.1 mannose-1-phosphate guanylyltransferase [Cyclobacteriaceae bacterium]
MDKKLFVVLMAGGVGTRFWPYSRNAKPKQFLDVLGTGKTLIQSTYERFLPLCPKENIFIVTNEELEGLVREQLGVDDAQVLVEPMRKNTAPCIAYACYRIALQTPDAVVVVSPADHLILNETGFQKTIVGATAHAQAQDKLITLGIKPTRPETGYGYIQYLSGGGTIKKVKTFTEKPALALAKKFIDSGDFVWNSGIFIWGVKAIVSALESHQPEIAEVFEEASSKFYTDQEKRAIRTAYAQSKNISIDYGVMEKAGNVYVWLGDFAWSDLGSWGSMHELHKKDNDKNVVEANTMVYDTHNSIIKGPKDKLIVVQGLDGYLVGEFGNVIIVCQKDQEDLFRRFVNDLKAKPDGNDYL